MRITQINVPEYYRTLGSSLYERREKSLELDDSELVEHLRTILRIGQKRAGDIVRYIENGSFFAWIDYITSPETSEQHVADYLAATTLQRDELRRLMGEIPGQSPGFTVDQLPASYIAPCPSLEGRVKGR
jgi:hypothetical protein